MEIRTIPGNICKSFTLNIVYTPNNDLQFLFDLYGVAFVDLQSFNIYINHEKVVESNISYSDVIDAIEAHEIAHCILGTSSSKLDEHVTDLAAIYILHKVGRSNAADILFDRIQNNTYRKKLFKKELEIVDKFVYSL